MLKGHSPDDLHLRLFVEIAKDENLTKTAERLDVSQPSLSQHLHQLEEALGQRLMERHGRGLRLTEAGKELDRALQGVFHHIDISVARLRKSVGKISGTVTVAGVHNLNLYFLPPIAKAFCDEYADVHLRVLGRTSAEVAKLIAEGNAEIGLLYGTHVTDERLAAIHLFNETMVIGYSPSLAVAQELRAEGEFPRGTPLVAFPRTCPVRSTIDRAFPPGRLVLKAEVEALDAILGLAGAGLGVCILPADVPEWLFAVFGLERIPLREPKLMNEVKLVFRKDVELVPIAQALVRHIRVAAKGRDQQEHGASVTALQAQSKPRLATAS